MTTSPPRTDQGSATTPSDVASETKEQAASVASQAKDSAADVVDVAAGQARNLAAEARGQVQEQTTAQRDRLVQSLRSLGDELDGVAAGRPPRQDGMTGELARQAAQRTSQLAAYLEGRQPADVLEDLRSFARRRPGVFLLGATVAGVVAGRLVRGTAAAKQQQHGTPGSPPALPAASSPDPSARSDAPGWSSPDVDLRPGTVGGAPDLLDPPALDPLAHPVSHHEDQGSGRSL